MSLENLTKSTWHELRQVLETVAIRNRTAAWIKIKTLCDNVILGSNNIALPIDGDLRYAVNCRQCRKPICIGEGYVFKEVTAEYEHYDCRVPSDRPEA